MVGAVAFALLILIPGVMMILHGGNRLESEKVTLLLLLEVPVAMLSAALIAGETVAPFDLAAGALIIAAAAIEAGRPPPLRRRQMIRAACRCRRGAA